MRTRTITLVEFDTLEFQTLRRVEPSIRIAFPDVHDRSVSGQPGRRLLRVSKTNQEWDAQVIHGAWDSLVTLVAVLEAQSDRAYWERELKPVTVPSGKTRLNAGTPAQREARREVLPGAHGLVAPGTDVCGMLAESRGAQLREARDALVVLEAAKDAVGPLAEPHEAIKYEGV